MISAFAPLHRNQRHHQRRTSLITTSTLFSETLLPDLSSSTAEDGSSSLETPSFDTVCEFLEQQQATIIAELERMDGSGQSFSYDPWGKFADNNPEAHTLSSSGGKTRVMQRGNMIEKGACSFSVYRNGVLSAERAATMQSRQQQQLSQQSSIKIQGGDVYSAAALSIVLHSRHPMIPTFRSDVRIFVVTPSSSSSSTENNSLAWFGGGADLTPFYLFDEDITDFHGHYRDLCQSVQTNAAVASNNVIDTDLSLFSYNRMKQACDDYFYLPARGEHRGTGGIFFDDMPVSKDSWNFMQQLVAKTWLPSWFPIIERRRHLEYTDQQKQWQLLRRGRYLEFNLLYDRGVKFGLASPGSGNNPRAVEAVMVSAPPLIAWEYNHKIEKDSPEDKLMQILRQPRAWV
jgi:coproporphyrinogen III oxidase